MRPLRALSDTEAGSVSYVIRAWLVALVPSLALFAVRVALGNAVWIAPLPPGAAAFAGYSVAVAPFLETALMLPLALALRSLRVASDGPRVLALAALAAMAHGFGGSAWAVAGAFWPFVVYSAALFAGLRRSPIQAYLVTTAIHMLYNGAFVLVGVAGSLLAVR